jgi:hypothetical protein
MERGESLRKEINSSGIGQLPSIRFPHQHWKKAKQNDTN